MTKPSVPPLPRLSYHQSTREGLPLTFDDLEGSFSKEKREPSASRLAKEWIRTKKSKIEKIKKDINKSERRIFKELNSPPEEDEESEDNYKHKEEHFSKSSSLESNESQKIKSLQEYYRKLKMMTEQYNPHNRTKT